MSLLLALGPTPAPADAALFSIFYDPWSTPWDEWQSAVSEDLTAVSVYLVMVPEEEWRRFGVELYQDPALARLGLPDPHWFVSWQEWGSALMHVLGWLPEEV
jgi:hypothetical protein